MSEMQTLIDEHNLILMEAAIVEPIRRGAAVSLDPVLVHGGLIYDTVGRKELRILYREYAEIAMNAGLPFLMCTPTWRTGSERVRLAGADPNINKHAVEFLLAECGELNDPLVKVGGLIGCKNDCYKPSESLSTIQAEDYHAWQINQLADARVDFLFAATLPSLDEALGIAKAMAATNRPYFISFVINRTGALLDGTPLVHAIETIDEMTSREPIGYLINCAYPSFLCGDRQPTKLFSRLIGFQGNASSLDHAELDCSDDLHVDDVTDWGEDMVLLHSKFGIKILGGCCGTNGDHLQYIVDRLTVPGPANSLP